MLQSIASRETDVTAAPVEQNRSNPRAPYVELTPRAKEMLAALNSMFESLETTATELAGR